MSFPIRPFRRFPVQFDVTHHLGSCADATMTDIGNDRV
jgi:hypothetical protein